MVKRNEAFYNQRSERFKNGQRLFPDIASPNAMKQTKFLKVKQNFKNYVKRSKPSFRKEK